MVACDVDNGFAVNGESVRLLVLTLLVSCGRQPSVCKVVNNGILFVCLCKLRSVNITRKMGGYYLPS